MKSEKLLNAIGEIDDELISGAVFHQKKNWLKWGGLAAMLVLCASIGMFSVFRTGISGVDAPNTKPSEIQSPGPATDDMTEHSIVILDVNPSIALTVNTEERIVSAEGLNRDGEIVLSGMDLRDVDITVAVNAIVGSLLQKGYLSDLQNAILVSVEAGDTERSAALQERVSSTIGTALQEGSLEGSVLSQTLNGTADLEQMAEDYHISLGKAALIQEVVSQDPALTVENLAPLTITEIALISQSKNLSSEGLTQSGTVSDRAYISRESALESACRHAGVNVEDAAVIEIEFDSEAGMIVYEIEFYVGTVKYEYDIDARAGQVVKFKFENKGGSGQGGIPEPLPTNSQQTEYIGEEAAKNAALTHAGVAAETVKYINVRLEYDDGRPEHYEVKFAAGDVEYEYEIDLYSGAVLEHESEYHSGHEDHGHDQKPDDTAAPAAEIGEEAAKNAALVHAGLSASQVRRLKAEYDYDNGIAVYEVEFEYNGYEYEYKIDAATGAVLEYEIDD